MSTNKSLAFIAAMLIVGTAAIPANAQPAPPPPWGQPGLSPQTEEAQHPRLVRSIHELNGVLRDLQTAPDDFGGHKAQAIADIQRAIHSLKRALYYRLRVDDATLDQWLVD